MSEATRIKSDPVRNLTSFLRVYFLVSLLLAGGLAYGIYQDASNKLKLAARDGRSAMAVVAKTLSLEVDSLRHSSHLFVIKNGPLLDEIYRQRGAGALIFDLADEVELWFPEASAFTLADADGTPLMGDFTRNIGPACLEDLKSTARGTRDLVPLHGIGRLPHIDIVTPVTFADGGRGAFMVSFSTDSLIALLNANSDSRFALGYGNSLAEDGVGERVPGTELWVHLSMRPAFRAQVARERGRRLLLYLGCFAAFAALGGAILWRSRAQILSEMREILRLNRELEELSLSDPLTGLRNRRFLHQRLGPMIGQADREGEPLSLALLDIDHFKLQVFGEVLASSARRPLDLAVRFGGEEFVLCWYEADVEGAHRLVQELRANVSALLLQHKNGTPVTVSIGLVTRLPGSGTSWEDLLRSADQAMYRAKQQGRNRVAAA